MSLYEPRMAGEVNCSPQWLTSQAEGRAAAAAALLRPIRDYDELRQALDARRRLMGLTLLQLDERSGVQSGYSAKLIAGMRHLGTMSLPSILGALELDLMLIERRK